jgi:RNA polymerase sigma factor (sigma-70 family)
VEAQGKRIFLYPNRAGGEFISVEIPVEDSTLSSPDEYERIIEPLEGAMMRAVWRVLRHPQDAEDAFQDATESIWMNWRRIRRHPNPRACILRICLNAAYDALRSRSHQKIKMTSLAEVGDSLPASEPSPAERLSSDERRSELLAAMARLPRKQGLALWLRHFEELSYEEIASALGCRPATARTHYRRGCQGLGQKLRRWKSP